MTLEARFNRLRLALAADGHAQAVLSRAETLAQLGCFETPVEDWPVSNPCVAVPALLCVGPEAAVLFVADIHVADVRASDLEVVTYRSYDFRSPPDPPGELRAALGSALDAAGVAPGRTGVEMMSLPHAVAEWLRAAGRTPVAFDATVGPAPDLGAIRRASRL